ncbi:MAG: YtxH domain-containing protein [Gemmatimonadota bacterium]
MAHRESRALGTVLWMAAGAVVGAGAALLLAPKSGKETRRDIVRLAKKAGREAEGVVDDVSDAVAGMVHAVGKKADAIVSRGKDAALDAKKELLKTIDEAQGTLEKQRSRLAKLVG